MHRPDAEAGGRPPFLKKNRNNTILFCSFSDYCAPMPIDRSHMAVLAPPCMWWNRLSMHGSALAVPADEREEEGLVVP